MGLLAGVDEAGRGALAGPVVAAAVILTSEVPLDLLKDSKLLTQSQREYAYQLIFQHTPYIGIGVVSHRMIDKLNILNATLLAMKRAILALPQKPEYVIIDGNKAPKMPEYTLETKVKGDRFVPAISAASIVAKVTRDVIMTQLALKFPHHGFIQHKGYGTEDHYEAIFAHGITNVHRLSFNLTRQETLFK